MPTPVVQYFLPEVFEACRDLNKISTTEEFILPISSFSRRILHLLDPEISKELQEDLVMTIASSPNRSIYSDALCEYEGHKKGLDEGLDKGRKEGLKKGESLALQKVVKKMLVEDVSYSNIAKFIGLSEEQILALAGHNS
jgi:predicted transposase/invertase (TIGR01784 family)